MNAGKSLIFLSICITTVALSMACYIWLGYVAWIASTFTAVILIDKLFRRWSA